MHEQIDLKRYITGAELVNSLISQCSWFIHVMPSIATLNANAKRITDLANAIENVQQPQEFYRLSGRSDFRYDAQHPVFGLTVKRLELMHQGEDAAPFLSAGNIRFRRGEWTLIKGEFRQWQDQPHQGDQRPVALRPGRHRLPGGGTSYYAAQDVKLQQVSLKRLVCLPDGDEAHADARVAAVLHKAGLGDFIEYLAAEDREGKIWDQVLSGGQKQKLMLARILLHQPGILFLDEATGALDPDAKIAFHQAIKDNCAGITVISVMHEPEPPKAANGASFYHSILLLEDGIAMKTPIVANPPMEVAAALVQPFPVDGARLRLARIIRAKGKRPGLR